MNALVMHVPDEHMYVRSRVGHLASPHHASPSPGYRHRAQPEGAKAHAGASVEQICRRRRWGRGREAQSELQMLFKIALSCPDRDAQVHQQRASRDTHRG